VLGKIDVTVSRLALSLPKGESEAIYRSNGVTMPLSAARNDNLAVRFLICNSGCPPTGAGGRELHLYVRTVKRIANPLYYTECQSALRDHLPHDTGTPAILIG
jgi:hypothetical protein